MKRYILLILLAGLIGGLIYLSSIYLVKAELSFKKLAQRTEELEIELSPEAELEEPEPPVTQPELPEIVIQLTPTPQEKPEAEITAPKEKPTGTGLISMEFENANLKDVLKIFCQQSGLNFIAGENVELKPVTLYLSNVGVQHALDAIIKANGLTYEQAEGSDVFIVKKSGVPELKLDTRIFKLKYALAEDTTVIGVDDKSQTIKGIKETIKKLLTPNGDLSVDERTNSLIITDIPERFPLIEEAILDLDMQLPQILIEAKIVELSTTDLDQLGIKWTSLAGYTIKLQDPTRQYDYERSGGQDREDEYSTTTKDSTQYDSVTTSQDVTGTTKTETTTFTTTIDQDTSNDRSLTDTFTRILTKSDIRSAILTADDFQVTLSLLLTDTNIDIISSPNIVTLHAKEAKITVGHEYPIPEFAYNDDTSTFEVQGFSYKDIGIILQVIPYANKEAGNITMDIRPTISSISGSALFRGIEIPIISTREAKTNVVINDGDTLAIGGLLKDKDDTTITKVPVLGDIPILGRLFKHKQATKTKTNLIIFITPHILEDNRLPLAMGSEATIKTPVTTPSIPTSVTASSTSVKKETQSSEKAGKYQFSHR